MTNKEREIMLQMLNNQVLIMQALEPLANKTMNTGFCVDLYDNAKHSERIVKEYLTLRNLDALGKDTD